MITAKNIDELLAFGGLVVYQVSWFDPIQWRTNIDARTFNEAHAKERLAMMERMGRTAKIESFLVSFDQDKVQI